MASLAALFLIDTSNKASLSIHLSFVQVNTPSFACLLAVAHHVARFSCSLLLLNMSSSIVLTYVNGRGRAEAIRFVMAAAGLTWSESFLETKDDLDRLRASGKVPYTALLLLRCSAHSCLPL